MSFAVGRPLFISSSARRISTTRSSCRPFSSTRLYRADKVPISVSGRGSGVGQTVSVTDSPHTIPVDTYKSFGGAESAPSPLAYNLSSLASCTQVTGSLVAKDLGIKLGEWNVKVDGQLDPSVLVGGAQGNANWDSIKLSVTLGTDADEAAFQKFSSETERRCPITQLFKRSGVNWESDWQKKQI